MIGWMGWMGWIGVRPNVFSPTKFTKIVVVYKAKTSQQHNPSKVSKVNKKRQDHI
jgi:hypothetical protein